MQQAAEPAEAASATRRAEKEEEEPPAAAADASSSTATAKTRPSGYRARRVFPWGGPKARDSGAVAGRVDSAAGTKRAGRP